jgi:L-ascorbate peroxidase
VKERRDEDLLVLPTDAVLFEDPAFKVCEHSPIAKKKREKRTAHLQLILLTELCVVSCLKIYAEKYAEDQDTFFEDYAEAHAKLSNLGSKFDPPKVNGIKRCIHE